MVRKSNSEHGRLGEADSYADLQEMMQNDLEEIEKWCDRNLLKLNPEKTQHMIFSSHKKPSPCIDISIGGVQIEKTITAKYLGCLIDDRLEADQHVKELCNRLNRNIFLTKTLCKLTGFRLSKLLYNAYINSHLSYCTGYWCMAPKGKLVKLLRLQKRAIACVAPRQTQGQMNHRESKGPKSIRPLKFPSMLGECATTSRIHFHKKVSFVKKWT